MSQIAVQNDFAYDAAVDKNSTERWTGASVPIWLKERLDSEADSLGSNDSRWGGAQLFVTAAMMLWLDLPPDDRHELARLAGSKSEPALRAALETHWLTRSIQAAVSLGADGTKRIQLMARKKGETKAPHSGTNSPGTQSASSGRRGKQGKAS